LGSLDASRLSFSRWPGLPRDSTLPRLPCCAPVWAHLGPLNTSRSCIDAFPLVLGMPVTENPSLQVAFLSELSANELARRQELRPVWRPTLSPLADSESDEESTDAVAYDRGVEEARVWRLNLFAGGEAQSEARRPQKWGSRQRHREPQLLL
jgi:hypothetical protein